MKKLLLVSLLFSLSANATDIDKDAAKARDVIGAPGSAISDPTLGGTTTYSGTSVTGANSYYGDAYMAARNQQMQGVATPVAPTVNTPPTPKASIQKTPPTPQVATPSITGTSYRNHVNQLMSQSLAVVAQVAPPKQNRPSTVLATTIQQAKPTPPNTLTTATNTTAPTVNTPSTSTFTPKASLQKTPPSPQVATPSITGTSYRNHVNQLMSQSLAAVAPVSPPKQNRPSTVLATTIQQAKPATPNTPTTATNTTAPKINVDSSTLKPDTQIMTDKGIVTASTLKPGTQVAVPYDSAFTTSVRGGHNHAKGSDHVEHGTGNGANNAANSNSAHGLGGGSHIGGGRSGGGFHY